MAEYAISGSNIKLIVGDGQTEIVYTDAEAVERMLDIIERVYRAEAERDAVTQILGTLAPGGSIVNMAEAARNVMDSFKKRLTKPGYTIAWVKTEPVIQSGFEIEEDATDWSEEEMLSGDAKMFESLGLDNTGE